MTAPQVDGRVIEHLLDGQQRLTALWRSLYGTYDDLTLFVTWQPDPDHEDVETVEVVSQPRWIRKGKRYPIWCDDPEDVLERGYVPVTLLAPDAHDRASDWLQAACGDAAKVVKWINKLAALRQRVAAYNIPYLYLPQSTPKDVALDVFVKMNTSNIRLTPFDIVVAQVEAAAGASMHEILEGIGSEVPSASAYGDLGTLLLDVACLHAGGTSSKANYLRLDYKRLPEQWKQMVESLRFMVSLLEGEGIYDEARLPSSTVLPVVVALAKEVPVAGDAHGNARTLLRYYLWRAFLTRRYESTTGTRSYQDYIALREALSSGASLAEVKAPIFDEAAFPLPTWELLQSTRWPKTRDILARGVLALCLREGGRDIADDTPVTRASVMKREYHHLFPDSTLVKRAKYEENESFRALNCALITWQTNRTVSNLSPLQYLKDRVDASQ
ncbi:MAG: GmrSD restriction endonuclease domain-containing protein, partial [Candidatus Dormibacteria bacterium]